MSICVYYSVVSHKSMLETKLANVAIFYMSKLHFNFPRHHIINQG